MQQVKLKFLAANLARSSPEFAEEDGVLRHTWPTFNLDGLLPEDPGTICIADVKYSKQAKILSMVPQSTGQGRLVFLFI